MSTPSKRVVADFARQYNALVRRREMQSDIVQEQCARVKRKFKDAVCWCDDILLVSRHYPREYKGDIAKFTIAYPLTKDQSLGAEKAYCRDLRYVIEMAIAGLLVGQSKSPAIEEVLEEWERQSPDKSHRDKLSQIFYDEVVRYIGKYRHKNHLKRRSYMLLTQRVFNKVTLLTEILLPTELATPYVFHCILMAMLEHVAVNDNEETIWMGKTEKEFGITPYYLAKKSSIKQQEGGTL